jgi:hypothetical protein
MTGPRNPHECVLSPNREARQIIFCLAFFVISRYIIKRFYTGKIFPLSVKKKSICFNLIIVLFLPLFAVMSRDI